MRQLAKATRLRPNRASWLKIIITIIIIVITMKAFGVVVAVAVAERALVWIGPLQCYGGFGKSKSFIHFELLDSLAPPRASGRRPTEMAGAA